MRVIQLSNSANWDLLYPKTNFTAAQIPMQDGRTLFLPIPEIEIPLILDTFIFAIEIQTSVPNGADWRWAGRIHQKINTGLVVGGSQDATRVKTQPLFLDQINLILFEQISASFSVTIALPKWFTSASVTIWQYTGIDTSSTDQKLSIIESKIDTHMGGA